MSLENLPAPLRHTVILQMGMPTTRTEKYTFSADGNSVIYEFKQCTVDHNRILNAGLAEEGEYKPDIKAAIGIGRYTLEHSVPDGRAPAHIVIKIHVLDQSTGVVLVDRSVAYDPATRKIAFDVGSCFPYPTPSVIVEE